MKRARQTRRCYGRGLLASRPFWNKKVRTASAAKPLCRYGHRGCARLIGRAPKRGKHSKMANREYQLAKADRSPTPTCHDGGRATDRSAAEDGQPRRHFLASLSPLRQPTPPELRPIANVVRSKVAYRAIHLGQDGQPNRGAACQAAAIWPVKETPSADERICQDGQSREPPWRRWPTWPTLFAAWARPPHAPRIARLRARGGQENLKMAIRAVQSWSA